MYTYTHWCNAIFFVQRQIFFRGRLFCLWDAPFSAALYVSIYAYLYTCTANATRRDISESSFNAQSSKLERLFSLKRGKRDVKAWSFEL